MLSWGNLANQCFDKLKGLWFITVSTIELKQNSLEGWTVIETQKQRETKLLERLLMSDDDAEIQKKHFFGNASLSDWNLLLCDK